MSLYSGILKYITKPIVIVGLEGSGKTTVGRRLARKLNMPFFDSDQQIINKFGLNITEIYNEKGENFFKEQEHETLKELLQKGQSILSTGGGTFVAKNNFDLIKNHAVSVWIKTDIETVISRIVKKTNRPVLASGDKREILEKLMEERFPVYEKADIQIETSIELNHMEVVDGIIELLENHFSI